MDLERRVVYWNQYFAKCRSAWFFPLGCYIRQSRVGGLKKKSQVYHDVRVKRLQLLLNHFVLDVWESVLPCRGNWGCGGLFCVNTVPTFRRDGGGREIGFATRLQQLESVGAAVSVGIFVHQGIETTAKKVFWKHLNTGVQCKHIIEEEIYLANAQA